MRIQLYFLRNIKNTIGFMCVFFFLIQSCTTFNKKNQTPLEKKSFLNESDKEKKSPSQNTQTELTLLAEPITPELVKKYPHLKDHLGQIILGNNKVHVILAGVSPFPAKSPWQPTILDTYRIKGGIWTNGKILFQSTFLWKQTEKIISIILA